MWNLEVEYSSNICLMCINIYTRGTCMAHGCQSELLISSDLFAMSSLLFFQFFYAPASFVSAQ